MLRQPASILDKSVDSQTLKNDLTENQEVSLKKIIVECNRAVGSLNDSYQSSNFLLLLLFFIDFGHL